MSRIAAPLGREACELAVGGYHFRDIFPACSTVSQSYNFKVAVRAQMGSHGVYTKAACFRPMVTDAPRILQARIFVTTPLTFLSYDLILNS